METQPLRLYVNPAHRLTERSYIPLLYPFFGTIDKKDMPWATAAWKAHGYDGHYFALVEHIAECDYVVVPHDYHWLATKRPDILAKIRAHAQKAGKPLLADNTGDIMGPLLPEGGAALRTEDYRFRPRRDTLLVPYPVEDMVEVYCGGAHDVRKKQEVPSVGFVGWTRLSGAQLLKTYIKEAPVRARALLDSRYRTMYKGVLWRRRVLKALERTRGIALRTTERTTFGARQDTAEDVVRWRRDFIANLRDSDYALCVKGDLNASIRFYETLSMGRIPLLLDTESIFPLAGEIDYRSFCVVVDYKDADRIGEKLLEFHRQCPPEEFEAMQRRARDAFVKYLRMDSFSPYLAEELKKRAVAR